MGRAPNDGEALLDRFRHKLIAGIGNERRARVGNQSQSLTFANASERPRASLGGVVLMIGRERPLNPVARQQRARHPGVLGQDCIGAGQDRQSPQRHVGEVANRRRDDVKTRIERRRGQSRVANVKGWLERTDLDAIRLGSFCRGHCDLIRQSSGWPKDRRIAKRR